MKKLFAAILQNLKNNQPCLLATIIESSGSTPRSAGAYMLIGSEGRLYGTIGGGNLEYQAILKGQEKIADQENFLFEYVLSAENVADLGMICGGKCTVLYYYLAPEQDNIDFTQQALAAAEANEPYYLLLPAGNGKIKIMQDVPMDGFSGIFEYEGHKYYAEKFAYDGKVYIFGGGHLAQELVPVLSHLDFRCIVIDDRKEFTDSTLFPGAEKVLLADFKNLQNVLSINKNDYVAVMTRGHLHDADVERFVLTTEASYIGVVGSRKKADITRLTLRNEGFSEENLNRIVTPIGLDIGSETPAEIAVSIAAQLIKVRAEKYI